MKQLKEFLNVGHLLSREELRNVKGGQTAPPPSEVWNCACVGGGDGNCIVTQNGTYFDNCCGYTGAVNGPDASNYVDDCVPAN